MNETQLLEKIESGVTGLNSRLTAVEADTKKALTQSEEILSQPDRWPKELKAGFEDLTKLKQTANGFDSELKKVGQAIARIDTLVRNEQRYAFGDPIARFCADEEKRNWVNAVARRLLWPSAKLPAHLEKALTGVDSSLGQAVIPTEYMAEIYSVLSTYGAYNTLHVIKNIPARTNSFPLMSARPTAVWIGAGTGGSVEGTAITEGSFTGSSVSLAIQTAAALLYASREQMQDATSDMAAMFMRELAEATAKLLDDASFAADGSADQTDGGYVGLFALDSASVHTGLSYDCASGHTTVAATTLADWVGAQAQVTASVNRRQPKWWMHPTVLAKVALIVDSNGRPIFQNALEAPSTTVGSILGRPVVSVDAAPSTDSASAKVAVYGDPYAQVIGIRQDMELATSEHIKFAENQVGFRCLMRAGVKARIPTGNPAGFKPFSVVTLAGS